MVGANSRCGVPATRHCWGVVLALLVTLLLPLAAAAQSVVPIPALDSPVVDTTDTLDAESRQTLEAQARAVQQRQGSQLQVLMVPSTGPEDIAQYAQRVFDAWKLGRAGVDDGVLLVVAKEDRNVRIQVGYGLEGAIPDATAHQVIQDYLLPHFRDGDYAGGLVEGSAMLVKLIDGEALPEPDTSWSLGWKIVLGLFLLPFIAIPVVAIVAAWRRGPRSFFGRWALVLVAMGAEYYALRGNTSDTGGDYWIPVLLIGYLATLFIFAGALGSGTGRADGRSDSRSSRGSSGSSSSSWSGGGGRSGGGGASGSW